MDANSPNRTLWYVGSLVGLLKPCERKRQQCGSVVRRWSILKALHLPPSSFLPLPRTRVSAYVLRPSKKPMALVSANSLLPPCRYLPLRPRLVTEATEAKVEVVSRRVLLWVVVVVGTVSSRRQRSRVVT